MTDVRDRYPRPLVACLAQADVETDCTDVFPLAVRQASSDSLHLPDYDMVVAFDQPVNGGRSPVVIFGDAHGQRISPLKGGAVQSLDLPPSIELQDQWMQLSSASAARTSLHSVITSEPDWSEVTEDTIDVAANDHWNDTPSYEARRGVTFKADRDWDVRTEYLPESSSEYLLPLYALYDGTIVAALARSDQGFPLLLLPSWTPNKRAWLIQAWKIWVRDGQMTTPPPPDGFEESEWMTAGELAIYSRLAAKKEELRTFRNRLQAEIDELEVELKAAGAQAATSMRRLLTEQSELLVLAVHEALEVLGFIVRDMDSVFAEKREDLRVTDPGGSWVAMAEVKGYAKAGKSNDFLRFNKFIRLYARDEGGVPDACWYIVNSYREQPPAARPGPFSSARDAVDHFAEDSAGLVIPTEALFKLVRDVQTARVSPENARSQLLTATAIYDYTSPGEPPVG